MVDPTRLNGRVRDGLGRRFVEFGDRIYLLPARGAGGYRLYRGEREWLIDGWQARTAPARRFLWISVYGNIPFVMLELFLTGHIWVLNRLVERFDGLALGLLMLTGLPLAGLVRHFLSIRSADRWLIEAVGDRPLVADPRLRRQPLLSPFDLAGIVLLALRLGMEIYARLTPDAMEQLGPLSPAAYALNLAILGWFVARWVSRRRALA